MFPTQIWFVMKQSTNFELNEPILEWNECEMLTHSQQQSQAPKIHKMESTVRLTTRITMLWAPKGLSFTGLRTQLKSSVRNKLSNQQAQEKLETVNLTENVPKTLSKSPCLFAKRMSPTLHLLLFAKSM